MPAQGESQGRGLLSRTLTIGTIFPNNSAVAVICMTADQNHQCHINISSVQKTSLLHAIKLNKKLLYSITNITCQFLMTD